ncbi:hypothetical protein RHGRI_002968 [Rhododendron griersonianum]|uniref:Glutathione peroxidase n=1 Tax=Rhododendron griersonianum TaxID=479676 RepID=A0AAV6LT88_9ERIC|nr:hypothetical protein RHGRI_002968 [Rhododendron griersonianum]
MGASESVPQNSIHEFTVKVISKTLFSSFFLLFGFTDTNYTQLTELYNRYKDKGLEILAFPCNQFLRQEPGTSVEAQEFACTRYKAEYPIFQKIRCNGPDTTPVYKFLKASKCGFLGSRIKWNFTKFLVDKEGKVIARYGTATAPFSIEYISRSQGLLSNHLHNPNFAAGYSNRDMDRVKFLKSALFIVFLALASTNCYSYFVPIPVKPRPPPSYFVPVPLKPRPPPYFVPVPVKPRPPPPSGPLCLSQFALVNHACARVLLQPLNPPSPQESLATTSSAPPPLSPPSSPLPPSPLPPSPPSSPLPPPPSPPSPPSSPLPPSPLPPSPHNGTRRGHRHRHRHERAKRQGHPESLDEEHCCQWMQVLDAECVCNLLVHLPSILLRLTHNYTVVLSESCHISYQCEGGWKA